MVKVLLLILFGYVCFSVYIFNGYAEMNDRLQRVNTILLKSCTNSPIAPYEKEKYK